MLLKKSAMLSVILCCLPVASHASSSVFFNSTNCIAEPGTDTVGCFVNSTNTTLNGFYLMERVEYNDGIIEEYPSLGTYFEPNHYAGFSMSSKLFPSTNIKSIEFSLVTGDKNSPKILPGCIISFTESSPRWNYVNIINDGHKGPHC